LTKSDDFGGFFKQAKTTHHAHCSVARSYNSSVALIVVNVDSRMNPCGSGPVKLVESSGTIRSPDYDHERYPDKANCQWLIQAPPGKVRLRISFCNLYLMS